MGIERVTITVRTRIEAASAGTEDPYGAMHSPVPLPAPVREVLDSDRLDALGGR